METLINKEVYTLSSSTIHENLESIIGVHYDQTQGTHYILFKLYGPLRDKLQAEGVEYKTTDITLHDTVGKLHFDLHPVDFIDAVMVLSELSGTSFRPVSNKMSYFTHICEMVDYRKQSEIVSEYSYQGIRMVYVKFNNWTYSFVELDNKQPPPKVQLESILFRYQSELNNNKALLFKLVAESKVNIVTRKAEILDHQDTIIMNILKYSIVFDGRGLGYVASIIDNIGGKTIEFVTWTEFYHHLGILIAHGEL